MVKLHLKSDGQKLKRLSISKMDPKNLVIFILAFAIIGTITILATHSAGPTVSLEAESGAVAGPAINCGGDNTASNNNCVQFNKTGNASCPSGWPTGAPCAANTGVSSGTNLTPSGSLTITTNGTVIDGLDITGTITIKANNVTIKNSKIHMPSPGIPTCGTYTPGNLSTTTASLASCPHSSSGSGMIQIDSFGTNDPYTGLVVSNSELDCGGRTTQTAPSGLAFNLPYSIQEGILYGEWSGDHLNIHGCGNDALLRTNTHLSSSYIWGLSQSSACFLDPAMSDNAVCDHLDTIEISNGSANTGGTTNTDVTGNMIVGAWNSCVWVSPNASGQVLNNITIQDNWCAVSGSFYAYKSKDQLGGVSTNLLFKNNRAVRSPQNTYGLNPSAGWIDVEAGANCGMVYDDNNILVVQSGATNLACP